MSYFDMPGINWSSLTHMRASPLMYKHRLSVPRADTPALALGRVTHTLVFEPEKFAAEHVIWEGGARRGKDWDNFKDLHCDQTIFKPGEIDEAVQMAEAVRRHPLVQPYLEGGEFERAIEWTDQATGLRCKGRPDWLLPESRILLDLKTARSIDSRRLGAAAASYGYHCQLAHYRAGVAAGLGWEPQRVILIAVEKEGPHDVGVFELDPEALYAGTEEVAELLRMVRVCTDAANWPGRYATEMALQLPGWMTMDDDEENPEAFGIT